MSDKTTKIVLGVSVAVLGVAAVYFGYQAWEANTILQEIATNNPAIATKYNIKVQEPN